MKSAFERMREELHSIDRWLKIYLRLKPNKRERDLAVSLQKYIAYCRHDKRKWQSESAAGTCYSKNQKRVESSLFTTDAKGLIMRLNRMSSQDIVCELTLTFGETRVMGMIEASPARLKALAEGRGCLADPQLDRITKMTGKSWMRWSVDGGARHARSPEQHALVAATHEMLDKIDLLETKNSPPRLGLKSRQRKTIPVTRRQAV